MAEFSHCRTALADNNFSESTQELRHALMHCWRIWTGRHWASLAVRAHPDIAQGCCIIAACRVVAASQAAGSSAVRIPPRFDFDTIDLKRGLCLVSSCRRHVHNEQQQNRMPLLLQADEAYCISVLPLGGYTSAASRCCCRRWLNCSAFRCRRLMLRVVSGSGNGSGHRRRAEAGWQLAEQAAQDVAGELAHGGVPRAEAEGDAAIVAHLDIPAPQELPVAPRRGGGGGGGGPPGTAAVRGALPRPARYFPLSHAFTFRPRLCLRGRQRSVSGCLPRGHHAGCSPPNAADSINQLLTLCHGIVSAVTTCYFIAER